MEEYKLLKLNLEALEEEYGEHIYMFTYSGSGKGTLNGHNGKTYMEVKKITALCKWFDDKNFQHYSIDEFLYFNKEHIWLQNQINKCDYVINKRNELLQNITKPVYKITPIDSRIVWDIKKEDGKFPSTDIYSNYLI